MAQGLLSLFEDPVVGPQLALGLLSSGIGTMFSPPDKLNEALQGGLGHIGQALYYGGRQKAKQTEAEQIRAAQQASAEEFGRALESLGGGGGGGGAPPVAPPTPSYTPGMGMPPLTPVAQQGAPMGPGPGHHSRIGPEAALLLKTAFAHPENARALGPAITQLMQPETLTEGQEMQQLIDMAGLNKEQGQTVVRRKIDYLPTSEWEGSHNFLSKYQEMSLAQQRASSAAANADRDASRGIQVAGQKSTADIQKAAHKLAEDRFAFQKTKPPTPDAFDKAAARLNLDPGTEEYMAAAKKAMPGEGVDPLKEALAVVLGGGARSPEVAPGVLPETTVAQDLGLSPPPEPTPVATSLGVDHDARLEKRLGAEKATAIRSMLAGVPPEKLHQANGILRRVAKGTLGLKKAAEELQALDK